MAADPLAARRQRRSAGHATLIDDDVLSRVSKGALADVELTSPLDPADYVRVAEALKRYAPRSSAVAVAPGLAAGPDGVEARRRAIHARSGRARYPLVASAVLPDTRFDGLDMSESVEEAVDPRAELDAAALVLSGGGHLLIGQLAPPTNLPWLPRPTLAGRARRAAALSAGALPLVAAVGADAALALVPSRRGRSNAYRVLARRPPPG